MNRRQFVLKTGLGTSMVLGSVTRGAKAASDIPEAKRKRLGCTTVCFRAWFPQTRGKDAPPDTRTLKLLDAPALMADQLGVHHVEVWSRHFDEQSLAYCEQLRFAAEKAGSAISNIQLDEPGYDLAHANAETRASSIVFVKEWMDRAAACGATSLRANTGGDPTGPFNLEITADSFRQLAEYGAQIGVKVLVENHGGHSLVPENLVAIIEAVDSPYLRSLPDFGNLPPGADEEARYALLRKLFPHAHLVSVKGMVFDAQLNHTSYDIAACVRIGEELGFKGVYSAELWAPGILPKDPIAEARRTMELIAGGLA